MKKNKKKNPQQLKLDQAPQKNLYLKKIKAMMAIMGSESAYDLLNPSELDFLYTCRLHPFKIKNADNQNITMVNEGLKLLNNTLNKFLMSEFVYLGAKQNPVTLYDFHQYIETLYFYWRNAGTQNTTTSEKFKEKLPAFENNYATIRKDAFEVIIEKINLIALIFSNINHVLWIEFEIQKSTANGLDKSIFYNNCFVHIEKPKSELLEIDGKSRSIFRVGLRNQNIGVTWLTMTPDQLGMSGVMEQFPLKIYVQSHVVERLKERLSPFFNDHEYIILINAIVDKNVCSSDDGSFLFAYRFMEKKIGYLKATIIGDKLLFRTFLFITNNGTPEGKKLANLLGVQKEDKKYLGIDKLSTFINSDIEQHENLKKIFIQAGCGDLFEVKNHFTHHPDRNMQCADYLSHYLGLEEETEVIQLAD